MQATKYDVGMWGAMCCALCSETMIGLVGFFLISVYCFCAGWISK